MGLPIIGTVVSGIKALAGLVDEVTTTDEEKLAKQVEINSLANQLRLDLAKIESEFAEVQSRVVIAEAQSQSWLARNWRPMTMMTFVGIIFFNYIISPLFSMTALTIVPDMWALLKLGIGGYIGGRTIEKISPGIVDALKHR